MDDVADGASSICRNYLFVELDTGDILGFRRAVGAVWSVRAPGM